MSFPSYAQIEKCFAPGPIPDPPGTTATSSYVATITYDDSDVAFTSPILDLNFHLAINHTWIGDVSATLTSPAGTVVSLIDRPGVPATFFGCAQDNTDVLLDDEAATTAETQCNGTAPAINGTQQPNSSLSAFDGETLEGTWTLTVTDHYFEFAGSVLGTTCIDSSTTTPVTIGLFESKQRGDRLITTWQTSSETFNIGFNLWGLTANQDWIQLNKRIIKSKRGNTLVTQNYKNSINLNQFDQDILAVGISAVSSNGKEDFFGPFEFNQRYGSDDVPDYIDWEKEREAYTQAMQEAGYVYINGRYKRLSNRLNRKLKRRAKREQRQQQRFPSINIIPSERGLQRIRYSDLINAGINWHNAPAKHIAVSLNGQAVDRVIQGTSAANRFIENSEIIFAAVAPQDENQRYLSNNVYQLSIDRDLSSPASQVPPVANTPLEATHSHRINIGENKFYASNMTGPIPWLDTELFATNSQPSEHTIPFPVSADIDTSMPARITIKLLGGIDFPNVDTDGDGTPEPDHHIRLYLNRTHDSEPVWEGYSEGFSLFNIDTHIDSQQLIANATNELTIELIADNGHQLDIMSFDEGSIAELQSALLIAEADQDNLFKDSIEEMETALGSDNNHWTDITKVYIDDIIDNQNIPLASSITAAQTQIKQAIEQGRTLTLFSGHGSPNRWSFQNLVTPSTVASWNNQAHPTMMIPLACYTSYYETVTTNTLAHSMLLADTNAAVAISSAAVLAVEAHNKTFVKRLLIELTQNNRSLGESVLNVKRDLAATSADYQDIIVSWTTLADPTLSLHKLPVEERTQKPVVKPQPPIIRKKRP